MNANAMWRLLATLVVAALLPGCLIVSETDYHDDDCDVDCYDYEMVQTYCDAWQCWDEYWTETTCTTTCDETYYPDDPYTDPWDSAECYSDVECEQGQICVGNRCEAADTDVRGESGLCQACESSADCVEDGALCIRLNYDQATNTGEKVCGRACEYNHECPAGFSCINISGETGVSAQCLPNIGETELRTCNPSPELECVRANDCQLGESCVNNECVGPQSAECGTNNPCPNGQVCRNLSCVDVDAPECVDRNDCSSSEICIDGECVRQNESCVFNEECDSDARCVDGQCQATCSDDAQCGANERCRQGLCEVVECRRSGDCAAGNICVEASCEPSCQSDAECGDGFVCSNLNYCVKDPNVECRATAECARNEICVDGSCETPCSCNQQCGTGQVCDMDTGMCEQPSGSVAQCDDDCDCPSGLSCSASGQCE